MFGVDIKKSYTVYLGYYLQKVPKPYREKYAAEESKKYKLTVCYYTKDQHIEIILDIIPVKINT